VRKAARRTRSFMVGDNGYDPCVYVGVQ
jgi:hypothetical protein